MLKKHEFNKINSGDLLFIKDHTGMGEAIAAATGKETHVAILEVSEEIWVIEAHPNLGVVRRTLNRVLDELQKDYPQPTELLTIKRPTTSIDPAEALNRAKAALGKPYNNSFLPNSTGFYCSELIYECYLDNSGQHIFESKPMNWRDNDGKIPVYWQEHFAHLGIPVPEGVLGTNPTDLSKSPFLSTLAVEWEDLNK